ncbi:ABC transporter ATP-binding protein [Longispora albida]|uniref:ABC transporter ATP-binding protein n=1 Tax=Longispora albida TaxID=203523 RepID=UPI000475EF1A
MFRMLENCVDPFGSRDLSTPSSRVLPFLLREFRPLRAAALASVGLTVISAILEVWLIGYAGRLVDTLASTPPASLWREHGTGLLVAAALVLVVRPVIHLFSEALDDLAIRPNAQALALWRVHRYVSRQPVGWFRRDLAGRIAAWVRDGASAATSAVYCTVHILTYVTVYIGASAWLMASMDPRMALPLGLWLVLYAALMVYVVPRYRRASGRHQDAASALTGHLVDSYVNIDTLALFADQEAGDRESRGVLEGARRAHLRVQRLEVTMNVGMMTLSGVLMAGLTGYGIVLWHSGAAPIGLVAAALALSFRITAMGEWLLDGVSSLFGALGVLRKALRTIAQPLAVADRPGSADLVVNGGRIRIRDLSHHYGKGSGGLDGISLDIAPGEKVGLVGRSGAGKSTLVSLLLRFFEPEAGTIEIDGQDVTAVRQDSLRGQIAMVTQEAMLLHRSVRDNIAYGREASDDLVEAAARKASADEFIAGLRDADGRTGYAAHVGERGVTLSGGQRQRIAIARAIFKDAPILVLDEATSALDSEAEAAIHETLGEVMAGRTTIAVAHRLSTIARMDRIVVLDGGRIAEEGTHASLLAQGGLYAALWARQSGGFLGVE